MKNKAVVAVVLVLAAAAAIVCGILLANTINKRPVGDGEESSSSSPLPESVSYADVSIPGDVSIPELDNSHNDVSLPPANDSGDAYSDEKFFDYALDVSFYIQDAFAGQSEFNSVTSGKYGHVVLLCNYLYSYDVGQGVYYDADENGNLLVPISRLEEASREMLGFVYDFSLLEASFPDMVVHEYVDDYVVMPDGYDMTSSPYLEITTCETTISGDTITITGEMVYPYFDEASREVYGKYRYTYKLVEENAITPYQLVKLEKLS